jgi:uncharacterized protein YhaN
MKLRALELDQFRKFDRPTRISGFGDRVNVLCGPNEFGKSTILAAIRGLLFERHNSTASPIKSMQNWRGNAGPHLAMEFEIGGAPWRIEKRFLHQAMARLTGPGGIRFDNVAAEEELQRLLGFGASGKQGAKPEHMGVWGALWVTQQDSVHQADLSSGLARSTITACLDAEVGVLTGQESGQAVLRAVREQRGQFLDGNGKPKGRYKEVAASLQTVTARLAQLRDRAEQLGRDAEELRRSDDKLKHENDPEAERRDRGALENARLLREAALLHAQRIKVAQSALELVQHDLDSAQTERQRRQVRAASLASSQKALTAAQDLLAQARTRERDAEAHYITRRVYADQAQAAAAAARIAARKLRDMAAIVRQSAQLAQIETTLEQADAAYESVRTTEARFFAIPVTQPRLKAIREAARELDNAQCLLDTRATHVHVALSPAAMDRFTLAGAKPEAAQFWRALTDETDIVIDGIGVIKITPAMQDREKIDQRIARAQHALSAALLAAESTDLAEAETQHATREILGRQLADHHAVLKQLVQCNNENQITEKMNQLREVVMLVRRRVAEARDAAALKILPTTDEALAQCSAADNAETAAIELQNDTRRHADIAGESRLEARQEVSRLEMSVKVAEDEKARLEHAANAAETAESQEALTARLETAIAAQARAASDLAGLEQSRPNETAEAMAARIERYEQTLNQRQQTIRNLREIIAALRARIAQEGGHGLDEQIADALREQENLLQEQEYFLREAKILDLLLKELDIAEQVTKERYLGPVIRRVTPYLRSLFPGADIKCDDAMRITSVTRTLGGTEDFERLSDGTQEQIAVLSRLAFAEMLTDQGKPAMVILDDALAYADAERMERMFDILTQAAQKTQILVFTCREDIFARLGGQRLELTQ